MIDVRMAAVFLVVLAVAPSTVSSADKKVDAAHLRALFFERDFETAVTEGEAGAATPGSRS